MCNLVSIHAPVKSATELLIVRDTSKQGFNPRARKERDTLYICLVYILPSFNPRARKERDLPLACLMLRIACFNPRARKERDKRFYF